MVLHMWTKFCSCTHGKKITLSDSKDHCLFQFIASYLIFAVKTCYFLSSQVSSQVWCFPFVFPSPRQDCFASSCLFRCLRPCFELDFSKCFSLPVLLCRRWFGFLLTFHSAMKSSGSSRLAQKTLTLQKSKCCDGFPVLLRSFWLAHSWDVQRGIHALKCWAMTRNDYCTCSNLCITAVIQLRSCALHFCSCCPKRNQHFPIVP